MGNQFSGSDCAAAAARPLANGQKLPAHHGRRHRRRRRLGPARTTCAALDGLEPRPAVCSAGPLVTEIPGRMQADSAVCSASELIEVSFSCLQVHDYTTVCWDIQLAAVLQSVTALRC